MTAYLFTGEVTSLIVPAQAQADQAVAPNFERFSGLEQPPLENPAGEPPVVGSPNRPGFFPTPDTYTPGPLSGVVGVLGGQPLPVADCLHRPPGGYTPGGVPSVQRRLGVGQHGPSELGAAQTVALSEITNAPPVPGDLTSIIAGYG